MDPELQKLIDRGVDDGLDDSDIGLLVEAYHEHKGKGSAPAADQPPSPSLSGFAHNAVNDVKGILHGLNPMNYLEQAKGKQAADASMAQELRAEQGGQEGFSAPGDRLAKQVQGIPGMVYQQPVSAALAAAPLAQPVAGAIGDAAPVVSKAVKAVANSPITHSAVGAYEGYQWGGLGGAALGAMGMGGLRSFTKALQALKGASPVEALPRAPGPPRNTARRRAVAENAAASDRMVNGMGQTAPAEPVATAPTPAPSHPQSADPNWDVTVPIDAIKRDITQPSGYIHRAGESRESLLDALVQQVKDNPVSNAGEIDAVLKALRQRQHIRDDRATTPSAPAPVSGGTPTLRDQLEATLRLRGGK